MRLNLLCKKTLLGTALLLLGFGLMPRPAEPEQNPAIPEARPLETLLPHPFEKNVFLAASSSAIYETSKTEASAQWKKWTRLPAPGLSIRKLFYFKELPKTIFVLTQNSLYQKTFAEDGYALVYENRKSGGTLTDFALDPKHPAHWFLGTSSGLLESNDEGKSWRLFTPAGKEPVCFARFALNRFFIAHADHVLVSNNLSRFEKTFSFRDSSDSDIDSDESSNVFPEETLSSQTCKIRELAYNASAATFWLATQKGVFESADPETEWSKLSATGLRSQDILFLTQSDSDSRLIAATKEGAYLWQPQKNSWSLVASAESQEIRGLSIDGRNLYVAAGSKLLSFPILPDHIQISNGALLNDVLKNSFRQLIRFEPSAVQLQRAVVRDANTKNSKTKLWQAESRIRAFVPTISFGKDFSRKNNVDIDRGGTTDPDRFIQGPEDLSKGWDARLGWDLGDLIFSSNQTSIDSREKLMVELRHDLTAEATRLYYERRRLQAETLFSPAGSEQEHLEKLLQIEELTALLDGMTNGWMTKQLERMYREHPELEKLWEYVSSPASAQAGRTPH